MTLVNTTMCRICGLGADDIADYHYWDNYNDGVPANVTATEALDYQEDSF